MAKSIEEVRKSLRSNEEIVVPEELPEELGQFREAVQPGSYRFQLPPSVDDCFGDPIEVAVRDAAGNVIPDPKKAGQVDPQTGQPYILKKQRIQLVFERECALIILQSPKGRYDGEPFSYRISNVERNRPAGKGIKIAVADLTYLLRAFDARVALRTNEEFVRAAAQLLAGRQFGADVEWQGYCNPTKDVYFKFPGEAGAEVYEPAKREGEAENAKGCGKRYYMSKWPRDPKDSTLYAARLACECGAFLLPNVSLVRFRA
jgi:hypothetical protein